MEPRWRSLLCWGSVLTFLTLPMLVFGIALASHRFGWGLEEHIKEYKFLSGFYQSVTGLVFGLAGLRSLDRFVETKAANGNGKIISPKQRTPE